MEYVMKAANLGTLSHADIAKRLRAHTEPRCTPTSGVVFVFLEEF